MEHPMRLQEWAAASVMDTDRAGVLDAALTDPAHLAQQELTEHP